MEIRWTVSEEQQGQRLRQVLRLQYCLSRRQLIRLKQLPGTVLVNGQPAPLILRLALGDRVEITLAEHLGQQPPEKIPLEVIYEDQYLIIVNKPAGLVSHPTKGYPGGTLANALSWHWQQQGEQHPARLVTRLDKDTSGLVLAAKNAWTHYRLSESEIVKRYYGITQGIPAPPAGEISLPVGRWEDSGRRGCTPGGKTALTRYWTEGTGENLALVRLEPVTGRTHQLRIHMAHIGCPLLDDYFYGRVEGLVGRTALHAGSLEFFHPVSKKELHFSVDLPEDMKSVLRDKIINFTSL